MSDKKDKKDKKENLVDVADFIMTQCDGEIVATEKKSDEMDRVVYDSDFLDIPLTIFSLRFAHKGKVKGKDVYYFIMNCTLDTGEQVKIMTNHHYLRMLSKHLHDKKTPLHCVIKKSPDKKYYYLDGVKENKE